MGAGPLPRIGPDHPRRPPIPIVALDESAMAAARARLSRCGAPTGIGELAVWLAGVTGTEDPVVDARIVEVDDAGVPRRDPRAEPAMTVAEVALAVDAGRELAADAARAGATLVAGRPATRTASHQAALCLAAALTGRDLGGCEDALARHPDAARGPLHALRRLGSGEIAVLCGLALGAGEHGLGCVCDGLAAAAGAAVAAGIEPDVRPRLVATQPTSEPAHVALLEHLELATALPAPSSRADDAIAATLALLRRAAGALAE